MSEENSSKPLVGYKNPPFETRFEKGKSGNPNGRPRGSRNYDSILKKLLNKKVPNSDPLARRKTMRDASIANLVDNAIDGHVHSMRLVWKYMQKCDNRPEKVKPKAIPTHPKVLEAIELAAKALPPLPLKSS